VSLSVRSATAKMSAHPVVAVSLLRSLRPTTATTGVGAARSATAAGSFPSNPSGQGALPAVLAGKR